MTELSDADLARFSKLFAALDDAGRKQLMSMATKRQYPKDAVICREGEPGTEFYVLTKGTVTVTGDDFGNAKALATLGAGQFFGEMAVLSSQPRQATVTAGEGVELMCFPRSAVDAVLRTSPHAIAVLQKVGLLRTEDTMKKMME